MEDAPIRVLLVEDDEEDYLLTAKLLKNNGRTAFEMKWVPTFDGALEEVQNRYDVCLVDYRLGAESGLTLIAKAIAGGFLGPMILLTGRGDHDVDIEAMKAGAADYLVKDQLTPQLLERVIRHSIYRKGAELALLRSEEQLRQSQKMDAIASLAGGIAHDFNNLLSVILGYAELLTADLEPDHPMRAYLESISGAGLRAADLTRQLLAFSRGLVLQPRVVDLNDVVAGMEKLLRRVVGEDVELTTRTSPTPCKIMADPGQMEQIIMNLVANARDAMPNGGKLTIETAEVTVPVHHVLGLVGATPPGSHVRLAVSDTGIGIAKATQARMFEPFFTTKEVGKGTGLGLATVFGIVRQSGGRISVYSEPGRGTTFELQFSSVDGAVVARPVLPPAERGAFRGSETVLLVEDDERVRLLVSTILRKYGYEVLEAQSGSEAVVLCEQHKAAIPLLLTDVVMPLMSGWQLAERLLKLRPEMKVLYMSAYADDSVLRQGRLDSTVAFIQKPITPEALARRIRGAFDAGCD